ncbi:hypothetical protein LIER_34480 [Lithospermum erythrorhizon]|uniref:TRF2/HOY1 PH-like domain-containing protein n=1 Tax=Lithospermum erythrorhizon TaxID=34254 RepID=A0AAV3S119_LITER
MVQFMNSEEDKGKKKVVKMEVEDQLEEAHGPLHKRSRPSFHSGMDSMVAYEDSSSQYNPLNEPSPLGLRLRKSPSLLDLIQMRLSQTNAPTKAGGHGKKDHKGASSSSSAEKLKASNFPASVLRIGTWEYKSRYEGDLVAKCYFAKHKLVWEVLDGGLKNKIEIQWSDIMAIKANHPEDAPGTLDVVLSRQPLFYRETNPQPRKHTLWQATSDFTNGQASLHRRHFLQFPQGLLGKHFEKLIQCDPRLNYLSQQPEITLDSPFFEPRPTIFEDLSEQTSSFERSPSPFSMHDISSPSIVQSSSSKNDHVGRFPDSLHRETPSPSSVMSNHATEIMKNIGAEHWKDLSTLDNIRVPGLNHSMSMSDLVSHLEHRISEQRTSNDLALSEEELKSLDVLEEISRCLFSDTQNMPDSDEKSLMSRVNSLCCLLQKDPSTAQNLQSTDDNHVDGPVAGNRTVERPLAPVFETELIDASSARDADEGSDCKTSSMTRNDSVGDLLLNLPRIASLPQFLFNLGDDYDSQAR